MKKMILADAHVHIHGCFDLGKFLENSFNNFKRQVEKLGPSDSKGSSFFLLFSEGAEGYYFSQLHALAETKQKITIKNRTTWNILNPDEEITLIASRNHSSTDVLYLIAGHQIVTREKLEVLSLFSNRKIKDGFSLKQTVEQVRQDGGTPVIPWGAGKWWGKRGRILKAYLRDCNPKELFLGDNSGRPSFLPEPLHFNKAKSRGFTIIPGSDPLPFPSQENKAGSFGFAVKGDIDNSKPAGSLQKLLLRKKDSLSPFGSLESPFSFLLNQIRMQINKKIN